MVRAKKQLATPSNPLSGITQLAFVDESRTSLRNDFGEYFTAVIKDSKGNTITLQPFQEHMVSVIQAKPRVLVNIFRGSGKSTLITVGYVSWLIGNDRDLRIVIACKNESLAREFLRNLESVMKSAIYIEIFGEVVPVERSDIHWTETEKIVLGRADHVRGMTLFGLGAGGGITGRRADVAIIDDCADAKNSSTEIQRGHLSTWFFQELEPIMEPGGKIIVIGTRWAHRDIYSEVKKSWSERFGDEFESILRPVLEKDEKGEYHSIWEERFPTKRMLAWWRDKPLEFSQQMMNNPVDASLSFLQRDWLDMNLVLMETVGRGKTYINGVPIDELIIYFGVDPSWSAKTTADFSVICVGGKDPKTNLVYVLDIIRERCDPDRLWTMVKTNAMQRHPSVIQMESTGAQSFLVRKLQEESTLPIRPKKPVGSKTARFTDMSTYFTTRRVKLAAKEIDGELYPIASLDPLFYEWSTFRGDKTTEHDDCLDALDLMLQAAAYGGEPVAGSLDVEGAALETIQSPVCSVCGKDDVNLVRTRSEDWLCAGCSFRRKIDDYVADPRGADYERLKRMMTLPF